MTQTLYVLAGEIAWPAAIAIAWLVGECGYRCFRLPRISSFGIVGFLLASGQFGLLPHPPEASVAFLADFAFGLILFELGYRINLDWLRANPWLGLASLAEAAGTFVLVLLVGLGFALPLVTALLLAAISMSTSPAAVLRVVNEVRGAGQVSERTLHLTAFNCVSAVLVFKIIVGVWVFFGGGGALPALWASAAVVALSAALGAGFGIAMPALLRALGNAERNPTVAFAIAVLLLTGLTFVFKLSPLLSALTFGLVARHRRVVLSQAQRNFGALGDLLAVFLFVYVASTIEWRQVVSGLGLALMVIVVRSAAKIAANVYFAERSGIGPLKGLLTGVALMPLSVFAILLLEQSRRLQIGALDEVTGFAALVLILAILGPVATSTALAKAGETNREDDRHAA